MRKIEREPNTQYVLSLSYGKDSLACLAAIEALGWPLDRIIHAEVWATDTIPADPPPMVEFKKKADAIIKERWGIEVEHVCANRGGEKNTYEKMFYRHPIRGKYTKEIKGFPLTRNNNSWCKHLKYGSQVDIQRHILSTDRGGERIYGFPMRKGNWCTNLKLQALRHDGVSIAQGNSRNPLFSDSPARGANINIVHYLGIAADEPERIARHSVPGKLLPLVEIGWDEAYCRKWCEENELLSPIYTTATRGGCWFCHNQGVDQLRLLRKNYPDLWALLLKWDSDSPTTFHPDGRTVHDFEARFALEDAGVLKPGDKKFRWKHVFPPKEENQ